MSENGEKKGVIQSDCLFQISTNLENAGMVVKSVSSNIQ